MQVESIITLKRWTKSHFTVMWFRTTRVVRTLQWHLLHFDLVLILVQVRTKAWLNPLFFESTLPYAGTWGMLGDMSYKIRNWSTSNCVTNPNSAVGDCAEVMVSITRSCDAHGRKCSGNCRRQRGHCRKHVHVIRSTEKEEGRLWKVATP